jgi:RiboL-PSP-HEPN
MDIDQLPAEMRKNFKKFEDLPKDEQDEITEAFQTLLKRQTSPHSKYVAENTSRLRRLLDIYLSRLKRRGFVKSAHDGSEDILRAIVVLTHASLEDFLRTLAVTFLPFANEEVLNRIPLAGLDRPAEKFSLGKLLLYKGQTVENVIQKSVREHLDRSTYNSIRDIVSLLETLGFDPSAHKDSFPKIEAMIKRRHQIVHHADLVRTGKNRRLSLAAVNVFEVIEWIMATNHFMFSLFPGVAHKTLDLKLRRKVTRLKRHLMASPIEE